MGDYAKAEPLFRQTLEIQKQALGEKHPGHAIEPGEPGHAICRTWETTRKRSPSAARRCKSSRHQLDLTAAVQSERQQLKMSESVRSYLDDYLSVTEKAGVSADKVYAEVLGWKGAVSARQQGMRRMREVVARGGSPEAAKLFDQLTAGNAQSFPICRPLAPKPGQEEEHRRALAHWSDRIEQLEQVAGRRQPGVPAPLGAKAPHARRHPPGAAAGHRAGRLAWSTPTTPRRKRKAEPASAAAAGRFRAAAR